MAAASHKRPNKGGKTRSKADKQKPVESEDGNEKRQEGHISSTELG